MAHARRSANPNIVQYWWDVDTICSIMSRSPDWMPDILIRGDGYETEFYKKD
ncbi:MAG: hypothetical protein LIO99_07410 [Clostridiales bacterium]|nr:hypothetical protein [Clostridiales bacterium]